ncbi:MAG: dephospho-CoA kinase [Betaproteobacteria bacterium]
MTLVVGLTGGIGSGKSEVSDAFARLGVEIVDADALAHESTAIGSTGLAAIRSAFGDPIVLASGELDRAALRQRVFADREARRRLEAILHPLILERARAAIAAWKGAYGIAVVPLLLERGGLLPVIGRVLVVDCPEAEQVRRVIARSKLPEAEVRAIMATQLDRPTRLARADDVIDNAGPVSAIAPQVAKLDRVYRALAGGSPDRDGAS